jgi:hypothetical protein
MASYAGKKESGGNGTKTIGRSASLMNYQFTIQMSEEHINYAWRKIFARRFGIGFPIVCLLILITFVEHSFAGQWDWFSGSLLGIAIFYSGRFISSSMQRRTAQLSRLKKMKDNVINSEFSDELFKVKSEAGSAELKWETFKALWIFPQVWVLLHRKGTYLLLPIDKIGNDVKDFLKQKIISIGGKIK